MQGSLKLQATGSTAKKSLNLQAFERWDGGWGRFIV
jgi:hypothetical protein